MYPYDDGLVFTNDWSLSKAFTKLKAVDLRYEGGPEDFFLDLEQLSGLTSLSAWKLRRDSLTASVPHPTGLASLRLGDEWGDADLAPLFSSFKQLTHLTLNNLRGGSSLTCLNGLIELEVSTINADALSDWTDVLACMPHLKYLKLRNNCSAEVSISSPCLSGMKELAILSLWNVTLDGCSYSTVGQLPELAHLELVYCDGTGSTLHSEINRLTNLHSLHFFQPEASDLVNHIENGSLPRLRELWIPPLSVSAESVKELFGKLPSLRRLQKHIITI